MASYPSSEITTPRNFVYIYHVLKETECTISFPYMVSRLHQTTGINYILKERIWTHPTKLPWLW